MEEKEIGERIKKARKLKNLTQKQLSDISKIDVTSISRYENGNQFPNLDTIIKISVGLECSLDYLVFGDEKNIFVKRKAESEEEVIFRSLSKLFEEKVLDLYEDYNDGELYISRDSDLYWDFCQKMEKFKDFNEYMGSEYNKAKENMIKSYAEKLRKEKEDLNKLPF